MAGGGRCDLDVVGHHARPDVVRLYMNERSMPPVVWGADLTEDSGDDEGATI